MFSATAGDPPLRCGPRLRLCLKSSLLQRRLASSAASSRSAFCCLPNETQGLIDGPAALGNAVPYIGRGWECIRLYWNQGLPSKREELLWASQSTSLLFGVATLPAGGRFWRSVRVKPFLDLRTSLHTVQQAPALFPSFASVIELPLPGLSFVVDQKRDRAFARSLLLNINA